MDTRDTESELEEPAPYRADDPPQKQGTRLEALSRFVGRLGALRWLSPRTDSLFTRLPEFRPAHAGRAVVRLIAPRIIAADGAGQLRFLLSRPSQRTQCRTSSSSDGASHALLSSSTSGRTIIATASVGLAASRNTRLTRR